MTRVRLIRGNNTSYDYGFQRIYNINEQKELHSDGRIFTEADIKELESIPSFRSYIQDILFYEGRQLEQFVEENLTEIPKNKPWEDVLEEQGINLDDIKKISSSRYYKLKYYKPIYI